MAPRICTVGSSTRTLPEFLETLAAFGVRTVADVRRFPASGRYPHFTREALAGSPRGAGTAYAGLGDDLGGYRSGGYGAYRQRASFARGLCRLEAPATRSPTAIACAERLPWRCHRRFIATALRRRGWEVVHLTGTGPDLDPRGGAGGMRKPLAAGAATVVALLLGWGASEWWSLPDVRGLASAPPARTALMNLRAAEAAVRGRTPLRQQLWVPLGTIPPHLKHAVLVAEDAGFYGHGGVDFAELEEALLRDLKAGHLLRGGSTLTMQLARTLYLSPRKSPLRKLREILIAWRLEAALSKDRILELYLNLVEWGDGIYGAGAAARHYFGKGVADLTPQEAAALAARLPSPRRMSSQALAWRTRVVLDRMRRFGFLPVGAEAPESLGVPGRPEPAPEDWEETGEEDEGHGEGEP